MIIHTISKSKSLANRACPAMLLAMGTLAGCASSGSSWSQWGGPNRDFKVTGASISTTWPTGGPAQLWSRELGNGYSTVLSEGHRLYASYRDGDEEAVVALAANTGKTIWEHRFAVPVSEQYETRFGKGPNSSPLIVGQRIFSASFTGEMRCLDKGTGKLLWSHKLLGNEVPKSTKFGYSASPIAYKDTIIALAANDNQSFVAFNQKDGTIAWQRGGFETSYASPILINVDGQDQLVGVMAAEVVGIDPNNGELLWQHKHENQWHTNITTPIWGKGNLLFVTSGGEAGSRMLNLSLVDGKTKVKEVWASTKAGIGMSNVIWNGDYLYCSTGSEGPKFVSAINAKTGDVVWKKRGFGRANFVQGDGKLVLFDDKGVLAIVSASPKGLTVHAKKEYQSKGQSWSVPTLVGSTLYIRNGKNLTALDVG